jgi:hypothetical protein
MKGMGLTENFEKHWHRPSTKAILTVLISTPRHPFDKISFRSQRLAGGIISQEYQQLLF